MQSDIFNRINFLKRSIKDLEKELEEIQKTCNHEEFSIDLLDNSLIKRCKNCDAFLGYPNDEEKKQSGYI
tara:strand:- start:2955 stop:3164 length:210 start_codon:yes stop_codon:yes gene_type:complete